MPDHKSSFSRILQVDSINDKKNLPNFFHEWALPLESHRKKGMHWKSIFLIQHILITTEKNVYISGTKTCNYVYNKIMIWKVLRNSRSALCMSGEHVNELHLVMQLDCTWMYDPVSGKNRGLCFCSNNSMPQWISCKGSTLKVFFEVAIRMHDECVWFGLHLLIWSWHYWSQACFSFFLLLCLTSRSHHLALGFEKQAKSLPPEW